MFYFSFLNIVLLTVQKVASYLFTQSVTEYCILYHRSFLKSVAIYVLKGTVASFFALSLWSKWIIGDPTLDKN